jgi:hypothetical protein
MAAIIKAKGQHGFTVITPNGVKNTRTFKPSLTKPAGSTRRDTTESAAKTVIDRLLNTEL